MEQRGLSTREAADRLRHGGPHRRAGYPEVDEIALMITAPCAWHPRCVVVQREGVS